MSRTTQWVSRLVAFPRTIMCLWVVAITYTGSAQAIRQGQYGLTLDWVGGAPPGFMCVGDSAEMMFLIRFAPDPNLIPLAPLAPLGQPIPVPSPVGGSLDIKATQGTLSPSHWTLDFGTGGPMAASFTYNAKTQGEEGLTLAYNYNDSVNTYTGSTPPVRFRVQQCDYRVKVTLQEVRTIRGVGGNATFDLTGEGGFRIKSDERNSRGNIPFGGLGKTEAIERALFFDRRLTNTSARPMSGQGTLTINGEILPDGTLVMDIVLFPVELSSSVSIATGPDGSANRPVPPHLWSPDSSDLWGMHFPSVGGTQPISGPGKSPSPEVTATMSGQVTVSW